jgi:hypothetical protein
MTIQAIAGDPPSTGLLAQTDAVTHRKPSRHLSYGDVQ